MTRLGRPPSGVAVRRLWARGVTKPKKSCIREKPIAHMRSSTSLMEAEMPPVAMAPEGVRGIEIPDDLTWKVTILPAPEECLLDGVRVVSIPRLRIMPPGSAEFLILDCGNIDAFEPDVVAALIDLADRVASKYLVVISRDPAFLRHPFLRQSQRIHVVLTYEEGFSLIRARLA